MLLNYVKKTTTAKKNLHPKGTLGTMSGSLNGRLKFQFFKKNQVLNLE